MSEQPENVVCVEVWLHFDGHHGEGLEFVEAETPNGESIELGEWDIGSGGSTLKFEVPEREVSTERDQ